MKKTIIIVAVLLLGGGGYFLFKSNQAKAPTEENNQNQVQQTTGNNQQVQPQATTTSGQTPGLNNAGKPNYTASTSPTGGETPGVDIQVVGVDYNGTTFTPAKVNIKVNDWIFFKNDSTLNFWPVAASSDTSAAYPKFNPAGALAAGGEYKFQFTKAGSWSFGDNLHPGPVFNVNVAK